jgi:hypothetical protein
MTCKPTTEGHFLQDAFYALKPFVSAEIKGITFILSSTCKMYSCLKRKKFVSVQIENITFILSPTELLDTFFNREVNGQIIRFPSAQKLRSTISTVLSWQNKNVFAESKYQYQSLQVIKGNERSIDLKKHLSIDSIDFGYCWM